MQITNFPPSDGRPSESGRAFAGSSSGAALLIALCFLVLLSAVILALFSSTTTGRRNASTFATGQETMRLADAAVNLVQGQIRDATIQPRVGWASQPGMVRAFDTSGNFTAYKLYSSDAMVVPGYGKTQLDAEVSAMQSWNSGAAGKSFNALYADLNAPAVVKRPDPGNPAQSIDTPVFPIADPAAIGAVEGFDATTTVAGTTLGNGINRRLPMPVKWIYVLKDGQMTAPSGGTGTLATFSGSVVPTQDNPIVGRIAFWADDDTCKLNINTASEGSFWDVPRVSSNMERDMANRIPVANEFQAISGHPATASLSTLFSTASSATSLPGFGMTDANYTTGFAPFYKLAPRTSDETDTSGRFSSSNQSTSRGGSRDTVGRTGTGSTDRLYSGPVVFDSDRLYATADEFVFQPDRSSNSAILASVTPAAISQRDFFMTAQSRAPETTIFGTPRISLWPVMKDAKQGNTEIQSAKDKLLMFCASLPLPTDPPTRLPYYFQRDKVAMIENSTKIANPSAGNATMDVGLSDNTRLFTYMDKLFSAALPGAGGNFHTKWGGTDGMIIRIFDYSRAGANLYQGRLKSANAADERLWSYVVPFSDQGGYVVPSKRNGKLGFGSHTILCEAAVSFIPTQIENTYTNVKFNNGGTTVDVGTVVETATVVENAPLSATNPVRTYSPTLESLRAANPGFDLDPATMRVPSSQKTLAYKPWLVFNLFKPTPNSDTSTPVVRYRIKSNSLGMGFPSSGEMFNKVRAGGGSETGRNYAFTGLQSQFYRNGGSAGQPARTFDSSLNDPENNYAFVGEEQTVSSGATVFNFSGGTVEVELLEPESSSPQVLQTYSFVFPSVSSLPLPQHVGSDGTFLRAVDDARAPLPNIDNGAIIPPGEYHLGGLQARAGELNSPSNTLPASNSVFKNHRYAMFRPGDIIRSVRVDPSASGIKGDLRMLALYENVPSNFFTPHPNYNASVSAYTGAAAGNANARKNRFAHSLRNDAFVARDDYNYSWGDGNNNNNQLARGPYNASLGAGYDYSLGGANRLLPGGLVSGVTIGLRMTPVIAAAMSAVTAPGDFTANYGACMDGASATLPDFGNLLTTNGAYFQGLTNYANDPGTGYEPNRQIPSPVALGTLPSDSDGKPTPWQTLLFCPPEITLAGSSHPGASGPADHLVLDNFWMPVVEPYAISEPLSTAGKINLNFQIAPFTHIERSTGLHALLKAQRVSAVSDADGQKYKAYTDQRTGGWTDANQNLTTRYLVDIEETLRGPKTKFANGSIYLSASEVCTISLVPEGQSASNLATWWGSRKLTGDNLREAPYNALYSRVTTKSNTFTVHYRVQALRQPPRAGRNWAEWDEEKDQIVGEYRGSTTIERFLDPNAENIPDYTTVNLSGTYDPIDKWYRWRVVSQKQFAP